ncbi:HypC/HybG/HupF family hydrogenase formation chaperone [Helicobacter sp. TUL]|uniref:HypC/HybG/HupF family hydrogenase formation chaperone n=1 Tax=Helicobacter sp. TUL TaxID=1848928 RepID=UPI000BABB88F|nr:HypC/HybG/HupF family hydrogenase formation chaperone [Helicobacter sp. TUL]PAU99819.1 hydrogenase assembly protein HupF [Helicobacter sp. TUL]
MCLAIPSKVDSIDRVANVAMVDTLGVKREARLDLFDGELAIGDWVLLHIGFVMNKIDEQAAYESLKLYEEIIESMEEEERELQEANR